MSNKISRTDVVDEEFVDAIELASDGYTYSYRTVDIVSTTASSRNIVITTPTILDRLDNVDEPVQVGDIFEIISGAAAGFYTVQVIINPADTFRVIENIVDSIDGYGNFYHPSGASKVGVDTTNFIHSFSDNVQDVLYDLDQSISDGYAYATGIGQILYSINGTTFQPALPITTIEGWLVNSLGFLQVVAASSNPNNSIPGATEIGQVLLSLNGLTFDAVTPITTDEGWLVNDQGDLQVFV